MKVLDIKGWFDDWRAYLVEFLGTFLFVLISSLAVLGEHLYGKIGTLGISFAIGFSYAALVFVSAHLSGGYLNPAITVGLWLAQKLSGYKTAFFLISQTLASFTAALVLLWTFGQSAVEFSLGAPVLGLNIDLAQAVIFEAIFTAGLIFAVFSTLVDRRGPISFGPFVLGLFLVAASVILLPITGASLNPVRALGPAVISSSTNTLAVWVIGPLAGSLFAIVYEVVFMQKVRR